ncbi:TPA: LPXTG cell wall anchor domain-containing protein [Streptococcus suis]|nr:LPXTG cell wall anchor domain-containing protein [Streptococcus suis]
MKIKRSSSKKQLHKWTKLGVGLAAVTVLGGGTTLAGIDLFHVDTVYAQAQESVTAVLTFYDVSDLSEIADRVYIDIKPGESIVYNYPVFDGYTLHEDYDSVLILDYDSVARRNGETIATGFRKVEKPAETPAEKPVETAKQPEPAGATSSTDTPSVPQPTNSQPTVEDRYDVVTLQYRDENGEDFGDDLMMVYPTSSQRITPPTFEGYEFKEASVGENYLMYRKPISLPYEHRFAQVLTEQDLQSHSNFLGGRIKETQDSLRDGSAYTYILNYRKTGPSQQAPQTKRVRFIIDVKPDVVTGTSSFDGFSRRYVYLHPGESYTFPIDESRFEIRPNQKLTYSYDEVEAGKDYSISVRPKAVTSQPADKPIETPTAPQPAETPVVTSVDKPAETLVDPSVSKPAETPAKSPSETPTNQPSADQAEQSATEPTVLSEQDSQAGTVSPTGQSASEKQATKQGDKEPAAPASQSKQSTDKPASTSQSQLKTLPATGEASSVLHLTGLGLLGLAGLVVKRRQRKSF